MKLSRPLLFAAIAALTWSAAAAPGDVDTSFNPDANKTVYSIALQADGRIVAAGEFSTLGGATRYYIARLNANGMLDAAFSPSAPNQPVSSVVVQSDGKVVIAGSFWAVGGFSRNYIARFHDDGTLDTTFNPEANGSAYNTTIQEDGKIIVSGRFSQINGTTRNYIARLNADGTLDTGFNPNVNFQIEGMAAQVDGKIVIGGSFTSVSGAARNYIARLAADGTLDASFNPNANAGVSSIILQGDGKIIMGGSFTTVGGTTRNGIARLNADGTLDTTFNPNANASVSTMGLQTDGRIVIGGEFTSVGGVSRNRLARLNADGTLDTNFDPNADNYVSSMVLQADGSIVIGGGFTTIGGVPRNRIARLANDVATQSLTVTNTSRVQWLRGGASPETLQVTFEVSTNGGTVWNPLGLGVRIPGGWELTNLGLPTSGQVRARARITGGDGVSSGLIEAVAPFNGLPVPDAPKIAVEQPAFTDIPDGGSRAFGSVLLGGSASLTFIIRNIGMVELTGLGITIDGTNAADFTITVSPAAPVSAYGSTTFTVRFAPTATGAKTAALHLANNDPNKNPFDLTLSGTGISPEIAVEQPVFTNIPDGGSRSFGSVLVGTNASLVFTIRNTGTSDLTGLGITIDGTIATDFTITTNPTAPVTANGSTTFTVRFAPTATGARTAALHIANNDADENPFDINLFGTGAGPGNLDTGFNPNASRSVINTALQPDGGIVIGGSFTNMGGMGRNRLARLNADGTLDTGFNPNANDWVYATAVQTDAMIVVAGDFTTIAGVTRNYIARLNADGTADPNFNPNANGSVYLAAIQSDGKIIIAGDFTTVTEVPRNYIARLNADGTLDLTFDPNANSEVYSISVQADGKIVIGGSFTAVGGLARNYIARLNSDGTADANFNPSANSYVYSTVLQVDGKLIVSGELTAVGGVARNRIARLNADGTLDTGFNPNASASVSSTILQADGKIIVTGNFSSIGGVARNYIARLNSSGTPDTAFNPNANSYVYSTAVQPDGKIIIGGDFTIVGGVARNYIARLDNDTATQSLTVPTTSRIEWLRAGTSPETSQVTFDLSTDGGTTWTTLGNGTRDRLLGVWEKVGLSLPGSGQVRARARTIGGYSCASSGLVEAMTSFSGLPVPVAPQIDVEQPAFTGIPDGGTRAFGSVLLGSNASLTFVIKNIGIADLTGLGITVGGSNAADFTITANPTAPVSANAITTFTVRFAPVTAGVKTAALHIANNDANKNPFDIILSGRSLAPSGDEDSDGITNETEINLAALGFDPLVNNAAFLPLLYDNALGLGLYRACDVQNLALGSPVLARNTTNGYFYLSLAVEKSPNLNTWTTLTNFTPTYDVLKGKITLEFNPDAANAQFYRVLGGKH